MYQLNHEANLQSNQGCSLRCCSESALQHAAAPIPKQSMGQMTPGSGISATSAELQISLSNSVTWPGILLLLHSAPDSSNSQPAPALTSLQLCHQPTPALPPPPDSHPTSNPQAPTIWFGPSLRIWTLALVPTWLVFAI